MYHIIKSFCISEREDMMRLLQMKPVHTLFWVKESMPSNITCAGAEVGSLLKCQMMNPLHKGLPGLLLEPLQPRDLVWPFHTILRGTSMWKSHDVTRVFWILQVMQHDDTPESMLG